MTYIKNYFKSFVVVSVVLFFAWFVSLQLTKQRVQLEAENRLNNFNQYITPYIWNFKSFNNDIVGSFQKNWQYLKTYSQIKSPKASNPQLSLNFSGEAINLVQHSELIITSPTNMLGTLALQAKVNLDDDVYYYLKNIKLSGKTQNIDLNKTWETVSANDAKHNIPKKLHSLEKISSLVLIFENPKQNLIIDIISMPYTARKIVDEHFNISCDGKLHNVVNLKLNNRNIFTLLDDCVFSSNYMWLKQKVYNNYPGSILLLNKVKLWQPASLHKINKSYAYNHLLNAILYLSFAGLIFIIYLLRKKHYIQQSVAEDSWYIWLKKRFLFKRVSIIVRPYFLITNYVAILAPTAIILLIMAYYKPPNIEDFKTLPFYFIWAILQQFILGYVLAQRVFYNHTNNKLLSSLLAAAVFSLMHLPSTSLMLLTFVAGGFWAYSWLLFKRLIPLALSHSILALMFYATTSDRFSYSAKIFQWFWE